MSYWKTWIQQPQSTWLRKALFQIHLWSGIGVALYVVAISASGSVLVYRADLSRTFSPRPVFVQQGPTRLSPEMLENAAEKAFAGYKVTGSLPVRAPNHAVELELTRGSSVRSRLFDPYTGEDLGNSTSFGFRATAWLLDFHDNLLSGETGRRVNGAVAVLLVLVALTGFLIWWPGIRRWRRSMLVDFKTGWKKVTWSLHSAIGIWFVGFILMWGITGIYLSYPEYFDASADYFEPPTDTNAGIRVVDRVLYWLGYAHFGRFGGRLPGCSRTTCEPVLKAVWAVIGLAPLIMAVTGGIMWWNRIVVVRVMRQFFRRGKSLQAIS
jgi:uncharacterized iron-regulated membrane protein